MGDRVAAALIPQNRNHNQAYGQAPGIESLDTQLYERASRGNNIATTTRSPSKNN